MYSQCLTERPKASPLPSPDDIYSTIERIGCVQIDTLQMVRRSQYLVLWSRLGQYDTAHLDRLLFSQEHRRLFEYWLHEACIIPYSRYRHLLPAMRENTEGRWHGTRKWLAEQENAQLVESVLDHVRHNGPVRSADFEYKGARRGSWWDWKPAKRALEVLYDQGTLMITNRVNFQRVFDLRQRVIPGWVDTSEPSQHETYRHMLESSMRALGICQPAQIADYSRIKRTEAKPFVEQLVAEGVFVEVSARLSDGDIHNLIVRRDDLPLLDKAADGVLKAEHTTFLSPFDNLFWARGRDLQLWNFQQILEAYKPRHLRKWGYFCLPMLHKDRLAGRFDPKLERQAGVLRLRNMYLEPDIDLDEDLVAGLAGAMRDFMAFHLATELAIERSEPPELGEALLKVLEKS